MNRNKWYVALLIAAILAVIFYVSNGMLHSGKKEEMRSVSVILEDSGNDRWNAFKEGLEQAAKERNMYLNVVSTGAFLNLGEECAVISREQENDPDGMIVELCTDDADHVFETMTSSGPVVLVGNDIQSEKLYTTVAPDQYRLGRAIAEAMLNGETETEVLEEYCGDIKVGILAGNQKKLSQRKRLEGVQAALSERGVTAEWTLTKEDPTSLAYCYLKHPVEILITLDNDETERAVDYLLERGGGFEIYGEGRSEKAVYYLDRGMIQALIVPNEFYMGYQSVQLLVSQMGLSASSSDDAEVDFLTVTKENLYDENVEKILFPVVR